MEAVGSAATILQLLSFTAEALVAGYSYLSKVKRAPGELALLLKETAELNALLCQFEALVSNDTRSHVIGALETMQSLGLFEDCKMLVNVVLRLINIYERNDGQFAMNSVKRIMWPFKEKEVKQTLQQLARVKDTLSAAVAVDSVATLSRLEDMVKSIDAMTISTLNAVKEQLPISSMAAGSLENIEKQLVSKGEADQRITIQNWLHPEGIDVESNLKTTLRVLCPSTGQWFLKCREFQAWLEDDGAPLWVYGIAGCGKTTLSAIVIQHLRQDAIIANSMLIYFFCDHRDPSKQSFQDLLHALVKQLLSASLECFGDAQACYHEATLAVNGRQGAAQPLSMTDYMKLVKQMCSYWMRVNLIVDALDECVNLSEFVDGLSELSKSNIRLLMTSRHDLSSREAISQIACSSMSLVEHMAPDIEQYLRGEVAARLNSGSLKLRDSSLASQIVVTVKKKADGLILIAKLLLEHLCGLRTDRAIKNALEHLPSGINATYDEVLYRMYSTHQKDISILQQILRWLVGCKVPLTLDQLAEVISLRPQDKALDRDSIPNDIQDLIACCGSLVTITTQVTTKAMFPDLRGRQIDIVALAHASVGEYLISGEIGKGLLQRQDPIRSPEIAQHLARLFSIELQELHEELSLLCLQYVGLSDFSQHVQDSAFHQSMERNRRLLTARVFQHPFLIYACRYWPDHFRESSLCNNLSRRSRNLLDWFLNPPPESGQYISWQQIYHHDCVFYCRGRPPLHYAIEFQLSSIVSLLLPGTDRVNSFAFGHTSLHVAAKHGALKVATELVSRGAEIDLKSERHQRQKTALHYAAEAGHTEVIRLLLECGASVHARSNSKSTPIYAAARSGSIKAFNLLLDAGADINALTLDRWTPLFEAIAQCRRRMAIRLLTLGADPTIYTDSGQSVLTIIAQSLTAAARRENRPSRSTPADVLREIEDIQRCEVQENTVDRYLRLFRYLHYVMSIYVIDTNLDTRAGTERDKCPRFGVSGSKILLLFDNKE